MRKATKVTSGPTISVNLFTKREVEIIRLICRQYSNQETARKLALSIRTIESHREHIREKTKSRNVVGVVLYAVKHRMIKV